MKIDSTEQFFKKAQSMLLTREEKEGVKNAVLSFVQSHPVRTQEPFRHQQRRSTFAHMFANPVILLKPMPIILILLVTLSAGAGVSAAAEKALPGDLLYSVKVSVNEELRSRLTISAEERAGVELVIPEKFV